MPLYQYKCASATCNHNFEKLVGMGERDKQECPLCSKRAVRDGFSGFTVNTPLDLKTKSPHTKKEIDRVVGEDAAKKWKAFEDRTAAKIAKAEETEGSRVITVKVNPGEKFNPEAMIGDSDRIRKSKMYSEAVTDHKNEQRASGKDPNNWDKTGFNKVSI